MPVLSGDHLTGRVDVAVDRRRSVLRAFSIHPELGRRLTAPMARALDRLAAFATGHAGPAELGAPSDGSGRAGAGAPGPPGLAGLAGPPGLAGLAELAELAE